MTILPHTDLESSPVRPFTAADARWAAETFNADAADFDVQPDVDEWAAAESAALDAMERGMLPPDLGDYLSRTSLVGHMA